MKILHHISKNKNKLIAQFGSEDPGHLVALQRYLPRQRPGEQNGETGHQKGIAILIFLVIGDFNGG